MSTCLLLVDVQVGFFHPDTVDIGKPEKAICLPAIRTLLHIARAHNWTVIHSTTVHDDIQSVPAILRRRNILPYCLRAEPGTEIPDGIRNEGDRVIEKTGYSAFSKTELESVIGDHDKIILAGVAADCCILHTAFDAAVKLETPVLVPFQAVSASDSNAYWNGLRIMEKSAVDIIDIVEADISRDYGELSNSFLKLDQDEDRIHAWFNEMQLRVAEFRKNVQSQSGVDHQEYVKLLESFLDPVQAL